MNPTSKIMITFYIKESVKSLNRSKLASLTTIITTSIAVAAIVLSVSILLISNQLNNKIKSNIELQVFVEDSLDNNQVNDLKNLISQNKIVNNIRFISKEDAITDFISDYGEDFQTVLGYNPLPRSFIVKLIPQQVDINKLNNFVETYQLKPGVSSIKYDYTLYLRVLNFIESAKTFIYIGSLLLLIIAIYLVYSTNRLVMHYRTEQFRTMKFVGATLGAIKIPVILNGMIIGTLSSFICMGAIYSLYKLSNVVYPFIENLISDYMKYIYLFPVAILLIGIILGFIGSYFAIRRVSLKIQNYN